MNFWTAAVIVMIIWGIVSIYKARQGIISDEYGNESRSVPPPQDETMTKREIEDLRERIKVLERIATDGNSLDASETRRISAEIDALRDKQGE